jgi:hypothetical protein
MRKVLSIRQGIGVRLAGLAVLFLVTTGQASTDGCTEAPEENDSGVVVADSAAKAPEPAASPDAVGTGAAPQAKTQSAQGSESGATVQLGTHPPADLHGSWQCMTRMQSTYEPMFTFNLKPRNTWTDLTFGPAQAKDARYTYNPATGTLRLTSAAGNPLYTLVWNAGEDKRERLVEQVPEEELYRAQVCYRYRPS